MHSETEDGKWRARIMRELEATRDAVDRGRLNDVIYRLRRAEALCMREDLAEPPPPPTRGVLLSIEEVMKMTGYSKSRLRHIGHKLAGYWKSPTGKVGWYSGPLEAALAVNGVTPE